MDKALGVLWPLFAMLTTNLTFLPCFPHLSPFCLVIIFVYSLLCFSMCWDLHVGLRQGTVFLCTCTAVSTAQNSRGRLHHHVINIKACWKARGTTRPWYNNHQHFVCLALSPMSTILYNNREWKKQTFFWPVQSGWHNSSYTLLLMTFIGQLRNV